jgi:predicted lipoprotein with Yx(FWY)xxD motif
MFRPRTAALSAIIAAAGLVAAACGAAGTTYGQRAQPTPPPSSTAAMPTTVSLAPTALGQVLVDGTGRTVYVFEADTSAASTCYGACAEVWPPLLTTGPASAGSTISRPDLGSTSRRDGTTQVTYHGHPLYLFSGDGKAGVTNGQAVKSFGANWYAVSPVGAEVKPA